MDKRVKRIAKVKRIYTCLIIALIIAIGIYSFVEPYWLEIRTYIIVNKDIPLPFDYTKIIFLSDIHHGPYFDISRVRNVVRKINREKPDIVLLGGDYVHRSPEYIVPVFNELKELKAPLGVYGVLGNHDHWENAGLTKQKMLDAKIHLIDNRAFWILKNGKRIKIGGVGDYIEDVQDIAPTINDVKKDDFVILVSHHPDYVEELTTDKIDLVISGHTHGGQVTFFGLWAPLVPSRYGQKFRTGLMNAPSTKIIVSNGVGVITPPIRLFARPQAVSLILRRE
jgi:uncharacterized protein